MVARPDARLLALKAKLFRGFSDPSRLSILEALREGPRSVSEIVAETGLTQPNASNHLGCLLDCGLVTREQRGRYVYYSLSDGRAGELLRLADELLAEVARGVSECPRTLPHAQTDPCERRTHRARVLPGTRLAEIVGTRDMVINSFHHQGIKDLARELVVVAVAEDGTIEAVEARDYPWLIGVQWHPERFEAMAPETDPDRRLLEAFGRVVGARARRA